MCCTELGSTQCHTPTSDFYFRFRWLQTAKVNVAKFLIYTTLFADTSKSRQLRLCCSVTRLCSVLLQDVLLPEPENCQNRNPCSSKIWRLLPVCVKNTNPMRFPREVQNLVKIGNKLWTISIDNALIETQTGICASLKIIFYFWF